MIRPDTIQILIRSCLADPISKVVATFKSSAVLYVIMLLQLLSRFPITTLKAHNKSGQP